MAYKKITDIVRFNPPRKITKNIVAPYIEMSALSEGNRDIQNITQREYKGGGAKFQNGDTLFARITPCLENGKTAKVALLEENQIAHGSTEFIVMSAIDSEADEDFVYYLARLNEFREFAEARMEGTSGRQRVSWQALATFEYPFPTKTLRKKIGSFLKLLDDKIQLNTQINQTLEAIAQAIFKSWFVDFEPVKAKAVVRAKGGSSTEAERAAMRVISGKSDSELDNMAKQSPEEYAELTHTASLFPDQLVDSELGEIPEGWEVKTIESIAKITKGKSYKSSELSKSEVALVNLKSFNRGGGYRADGLKEYIGTYKPEQEVFSGDLIISYTDVTQAAEIIGCTALIIGDTKYKHLVISLDVGVIRAKNKNMKFFLYALTKTNQFKHHMNAYSTGTTVLHLDKNAIPKYKFIVPSDEVCELYHKISSYIFQKIDINYQQNQTLSSLRDTLLPKLLSGELDVSHLLTEEDA